MTARKQLEAFQNQRIQKKGVQPSKSSPSNTDHKWLQHLLGVKVLIPNNWWNNVCQNPKLKHKGSIAEVHLKELKRKDCFQIVFKDESIKPVCVRYDFILVYAQKMIKIFTSITCPKHSIYIDFICFKKQIHNSLGRHRQYQCQIETRGASITGPRGMGQPFGIHFVISRLRCRSG